MTDPSEPAADDSDLADNFGIDLTCSYRNALGDEPTGDLASEYAVHVRATILAFDEKDREEEVGLITAVRLLLHAADDRGEEVFAVFDEVSAEMVRAYRVIKSDPALVRLLSSDMLVVTSMSLSPEHRGKGVLAAALKKLVMGMGDGLGLLVFDPADADDDSPPQLEAVPPATYWGGLGLHETSTGGMLACSALEEWFLRPWTQEEVDEATSAAPYMPAFEAKISRLRRPFRRRRRRL